MQKKYKKRLWIKKQAVFSRLKLFVLAKFFKRMKRFSKVPLFPTQKNIWLKLIYFWIPVYTGMTKKILKFAKDKIPLPAQAGLTLRLGKPSARRAFVKGGGQKGAKIRQPDFAVLFRLRP